jgi:outer membrane protein assembly factor BamB
MAAALFVSALLLSSGIAAEDWPTFRHDNARSAITPEQLAPPLSPQWVFTPPHGPEPAWPEEGKERSRVRFDEAYHVAAVGDAVYFGSSADDKVYCLDAATGQVRWSAFTGGPVRVAPTVVSDRVYVGSDDGCAYCLRASDGALVWKVRGSFRGHEVLGNGKMISLWPVRTGVLVDTGVAYFGAGVFPNESLFLCAVKTDDGSLLWRNDTYGEEGYKLEYGGISPHGPLLASDTTVFVPSGRAMPAAFNRNDGRFQYYISPGADTGGSWALLTEDRIVAGVDSKQEYDQQRGRRTRDAAYAWFPGLQLVVARDHAYMLTFDEMAALDRKAFKSASEWRDRVELELKSLADQMKELSAQKVKAADAERAAIQAELDVLTKQRRNLDAEKKRIEDAVYSWRRPCALHDALILSGDYLYAGGNGDVTAAQARTGEEAWRAPVEGRACGLAVANGRLFVSTDTGKIYGFGKTQTEPRTVGVQPNANPFPEDALGALCAQAADQIIAVTGVKKGFCLVLGSGTGRLAYELAKRTELKIIGVEPDPQQAQAARNMLDAAGLYGTRVVVDQGEFGKLPYADYFANLIVSERLLTSDASAKTREEFLRLLKPHGGVACFGRPAEASVQTALPDLSEVRAWVEPHGEFTAEGITDKGHWLKITRGGLKGEGKWTHQYADTGNTACSDDQLVKGQLGVLWFGRPGPDLMVERHARPAAPVAMDGRMFVQGENIVMAYDAYNGVCLWERKVPGALRVRVDSDMSDLALEKDGLYVVTADSCLRLDPATGDTLRTYKLPPHGTQPRRWGYVACSGHTLFGSVAAPLSESYGAFWNEIVGEDGEWRDVEAAMKRRGIDPGERAETTAYWKRNPRPDQRAFWEAEQNGLMWRMMNKWPAWGSVQTPVGAVTERIMASDAFFAVNTETGDLLWKYNGTAIAHPAIAIGDGTVFLADCAVTEEQKQAAMQQRQTLIQNGPWEKDDLAYGPKNADVRHIVALDAATGAKRWERIMDLTGCGGDRMGLAYQDGVLCFFGCFSNHDRRLFRDGELAWRRITAVAGKDGADLWSRPLNYLRRPVIMGDTILIEPRACDLHTGAIKTRLHPITGQESTWEFVRPGHCCSITSAAPNMFFLRGYFLWYYDMLKDQGMLPFGGIRPGCWINTIPANGLVLFPEASAGCTCGYPVRSTVALQPRTEPRTWSLCVQHGGLTPVRHMAINFGAPGDWRDEDGTLWFSYPHPPRTDWYEYGVPFALDEQFVSTPGYFSRNFRGFDVKGADKPWLFASGAQGMTHCVVPLVEEGQGPAVYTVRLYFIEPDHATPGRRVFSVKLQDKMVLRNFDVAREAGGANIAVMKEFKGIKVENGLRVDLVPKEKEPAVDTWPLINGLEVIREDAVVARSS